MRIERALLEALVERGATIAIAESCTGGLMTSRFTDVPGSSKALISSVVPYAYDAKSSFLGVPEDLLFSHGAVSEPVAAAMAEGARERSGADIALSTTCIAGPGGGTEEKPVGLSFLGLADADGVEVRRLQLHGSRAWVREQLLEHAFGAVLERLGVEVPRPTGTTVLVIADEVLQGHTVDTNSREISSALFELGLEVERTVTIGDDVDGISSALASLVRGSRVIIVTGGIGPTHDDRTAAGLARFLGTELAEHPGARDMVQRRLAEGHAAGVIGDPSMNDGRRKMTMLPGGTTHIDNEVGYGPGCLAETGGRSIFLLPGVPTEMRGMLSESVIPAIREMEISTRPQRVVEVFVEGSESALAPLLDTLSREFPTVRVGSYPNRESHGTTVRLIGDGPGVGNAEERLRQML